MSMREEFQAWWLSGTYPFRTMDRLEDAGVSEEAAQEIWEASRAGIVINLPEAPNRGIGYGLWQAGAEACREAIEVAGIKVAP